VPHLIVANERVALDFGFERAIGVGRHIANSLPLPDPEISRRHAQIFPRDGSFIISDLSSRNGLYINGRKCKERHLKDGDEISVGSTLMLYNPPEDKAYTELLSRRGANLWDGLPGKQQFESAEVTSFSAVELDELIERWFERADPTPLIPYKLRSDYLRFAMTLDRYAHRGDLCRAALDFLFERIGAQRMAVMSAGAGKKKMEILAAGTPTDGDAASEFPIDKDILRVVLHTQRAVYSPNCRKDFRYRHLANAGDDYQVNSFVAVPIFLHEDYFGFLYVDLPTGKGRYDFKGLVQAYLTGALIGKCLHWLRTGRGKTKE